MEYETPVITYANLSTENSISIKRDDLIPFSFGGNKVRIAQEFFEDMDQQGMNCMIGYGNVRSNLCRVLANMSYARTGENRYCHIISSADDDGTFSETNNSMIAKCCGAVIHTCKKQNVSDTVDNVMHLCGSSGLKPYYIYGDCTGHGNEAVPVRAYAKAYASIESGFDYIFLATGTGMTQAGLIAGNILRHGREKIIGISVSRKKEQEIPVIYTYVQKYLDSIESGEKVNEILLEDEYIGDGYGTYSEEILSTIRQVLRSCGIALDPTYTGKAFYGMMDYLKKHNIKGKKVLFIHTGGLPLYFDKSVEIFSYTANQAVTTS